MVKLSNFLNNRTKKIFRWTWENILFLESLFLLIFIPLYPKLPLLDIQNTWVYIRVEDFIVFFVILTWLTLLVKKKITLKTPLTIPILIFWIIGGIATIHGILLIFPTISNAFANVAFLSLVRRIEYMSLFFIGYHGMKDKKYLPYVVSIIAITLVAVIFYGFGQKYLGFPAFLTMNEEFAKGTPITLSALSRVPSTFAGHYDLAAYLVLVIPIIVSLAFGLKNWLVRILLVAISLAGVALLLMTVSRVSFFVLFISLGFILLFQKKKLLLTLIPVALIGGVLFITLQSSLFDRFKSTVSEADVLIDANTGESVGHVKFYPKEYFKDKIVLQRTVKDQVELADAIKESQKNSIDSTSTIVLPYKFIPEEIAVLTAVNVSTGENLPQGTGYTNLYLSPVVKRANSFFIDLPANSQSSNSALILRGNFIVKRASAYDLSFTTRFQGEWPRAIDAFKRNLLLGSGYGSVSLAVDNNYLRILGEVGLLGFISYFILFLSFGLYARKIYPDIDSRLTKSFILGFSAGIIGLALNATLIDVFEASKIAFLLWILMGIGFASLEMYQKHSFSLVSEIRKALTSSCAVIIYLLVFCLVLFSPMLANYFVADDFTWLRWAADCKANCSPLSLFTEYFTNSDGFFYRPGMKIYFYLMYEMFWLNQVVYHLSSLVLHFMAASLFFLIAKKVFQSVKLGTASAFTYLILSGPLENVFWISSIGHLFNAVFSLLALLLFIYWDEKRKIYYLLGSILSICLALTFHELGVVAPLFIIAYKVFRDGVRLSIKSFPRRFDYLALWIPVAGYILLRISAKSHWFSGDYSYNPVNLPFNLIGNTFGYFSLGIFGPMSFSIYGSLRIFARDNIFITLIIVPILAVLAYVLYRLFGKNFTPWEKRVMVFGFVFFVIALLPFLGLGNITSRYSYLSTMGLVFIIVVMLKKAYEYLENSGREIAIGFMSVGIIVFALFHIIQIQSTFLNWHEAGNKTKRFFISMESIYTDYWSQKDTEFHFLDVPVKDGQAWLFPVGLPDAVWFAFRNPEAKVFIHSDEKAALDQAGLNLSHPVFRFTENGNVTEVRRPIGPPPDLIMP
ncbi:O-antigen ligase family protein [Candidatus Roizmanbacteria bacterium]|nr:O-antigen ligase family protein [Candidatus Roizmanbacteria bacterium]